MPRFGLVLGSYLIAVSVGVSLAALPAAANSEIGEIIDQAPNVYGTPTGAETVRLIDGAAVVADELIHTVDEASAHIVFLDDSDLKIGANSMVVLDRLIYDPDQGAKELLLGLAVGIARFVSGDVDPDGFMLETPAAFVGIRGTDFITFVEQSGRTLIAVLEGIVIVIPKGRDPVIVEAGETLVVEIDQARPVILRAGINVPGDPGIGVFPGAGDPTQSQQGAAAAGDGEGNGGGVDIGERGIDPTIPTGTRPVIRQPAIHPSVPSYQY